MQTEPIESTTSIPTIEAFQSRTPTTQDGIRAAEPGVLHDGGSPANGEGTTVSGVASRGVRSPDGGFALPGERIAAYENAATPPPQHIMGFKVMKRSGHAYDGLSLTDCPNGACARPLSAVSSKLTLWQRS